MEEFASLSIPGCRTSVPSRSSPKARRMLPSCERRDSEASSSWTTSWTSTEWSSCTRRRFIQIAMIRDGFRQHPRVSSFIVANTRQAGMGMGHQPRSATASYGTGARRTIPVREAISEMGSVTACLRKSARTMRQGPGDLSRAPPISRCAQISGSPARSRVVFINSGGARGREGKCACEPGFTDLA